MSRRERRKELDLPSVPRDKDQPSIGEERFQYILQLMTIHEQNTVKTMKGITSAMDIVINDLRTSMTVQKKAMTDLSDHVTTMEKELVYIMQLAGYVADGNGDWARPNIPPRLDEPGRLSI